MKNLAGLLMLLVAAALTGCASTVRLDEPAPVESRQPASGAHPPPPPATPSPPRQEVTVHFVTDRVPTSDGTGFGPERAAGDVTRGTVIVNIPPNRDRGEVPRPGWFYRLIGAGSNRDDYMFITGLTKLPQEAFFANMKKEAGDEKSVFIFVHGYNNTFEDAALRTAQVAYDLGMPFLPALFSWSSAGRELAYGKDAESVQLAKPAFVAFVNDLMAKSDAQRLYVLGHSMGTRIVSEGLAEVLEKRPEWRGRIKEVLLAAADINSTIFLEQIAPRMLEAKLSVTIYASAKDKTLKLSKRYQGYPRVGDVDDGRPVLVKGMETIDATRIPTDWLSHSYIASSYELLTDVEMLFRSGTRAADRAPLRKKGDYWVFP